MLQASADWTDCISGKPGCLDSAAQEAKFSSALYVQGLLKSLLQIPWKKWNSHISQVYVAAGVLALNIYMSWTTSQDIYVLYFILTIAAHFSQQEMIGYKEQGETPGNCKRTGINLQHLSELNNVCFSASPHRFFSWQWKNEKCFNWGLGQNWRRNTLFLDLKIQDPSLPFQQDIWPFSFPSPRCSQRPLAVQGVGGSHRVM